MFELPPSSIGDSCRLEFEILHQVSHLFTVQRYLRWEIPHVSCRLLVLQLRRNLPGMYYKVLWIMCIIKKISYIWSNHQAELKKNTAIFYLISQVIKVYLCVTFYSTKTAAIKSPFFPPAVVFPKNLSLLRPCAPRCLLWMSHLRRPPFSRAFFATIIVS